MATATGRSANHRSTGLKERIQEFLDDNDQVERLRQKTGFLSEAIEDLIQTIQELTSDERARFVEKLDKLYPTLNVQNALFLNVLGEVCSAFGELPTSTVISAGLEKNGDTPVTSGGLMDVWLGVHDGERVVIKVFRVYPDKSMKEVEKTLRRRVVVWKRLKHPNVNTFRGTTADGTRLALVYERAENDNIMKYLKLQPNAPRLTLLFEIAKGLQYLHSLSVPHGNLKGANVLIDGDGHVRLSDYGLSLFNSNIELTAAESTAGNTVWLAPEIVGRGTVVESKPADVFALAMLALEIFTGNLPFGEQGPTKVASRIRRGERPQFPQNAEEMGLTVQIQKFLERCWRQDPEERPTIDEVVSTLDSFLGDDESVRRPSVDQNPGKPAPDEPDEPQPIHPEPSGKRKSWRKLFRRLSCSG